MYEILVPTVKPSGGFFRTRYHKVWDKRVRDLTGGVTVLKPAKGQWVSDNDTVFVERMIPVRVACSGEAMEAIARMTLEYYEQEAVLYYKVSDDVRIVKKNE
jgi:hypothetical protein